LNQHFNDSLEKLIPGPASRIGKAVDLLDSFYTACMNTMVDNEYEGNKLSSLRRYFHLNTNTPLSTSVDILIQLGHDPNEAIELQNTKRECLVLATLFKQERIDISVTSMGTSAHNVHAEIRDFANKYCDKILTTQNFESMVYLTSIIKELVEVFESGPSFNINSDLESKQYFKDAEGHLNIHLAIFYDNYMECDFTELDFSKKYS
jgi:hypothetical protein